jgi:hypothetical protein
MGIKTAIDEILSLDRYDRDELLRFWLCQIQEHPEMSDRFWVIPQGVEGVDAIWLVTFGDLPEDYVDESKYDYLREGMGEEEQAT